MDQNKKSENEVVMAREEGYCVTTYITSKANFVFSRTLTPNGFLTIREQVPANSNFLQHQFRWQSTILCFDDCENTKKKYKRQY